MARGEVPIEVDQGIGVAIGVLVRQGLVEQVVRGDDGLVPVACRERGPELDRLLPVCPSDDEQVREASRRIIDVGAGLAARRAVQIQDDPDVMAPTPLHEPVHGVDAIGPQGPAFVEQEPRVHRQPDMVEALGRDPGDIGLGDELVPVCRPEPVGRLRAHQVRDERLDLAR